jgi:hypothetical protein
MFATSTGTVAHAFPPAIRFAFVIIAAVLLNPRPAFAALPLSDEQDAWSDMLLPAASGVFDTAGPRTLTVSTNTVAGDLELGAQFGPSNPGSHYGPSGTLGGTFNVSFSISRLHVTATGAVADAESILILQYQGGSAGSLGTDYGINTGRSLLRGTALEVLLDAAGDNTLDILFAITSGDLQELPNQQAPLLGKFAPGNVGLVRITSPDLPSNWTSNFTFTASSLHVFGLPVPEPASCVIGNLAVLSILLVRTRHRHWKLLFPS